MIEIVSALAQTCKLAIEGGSKVIDKWNKMRLSDTQKELMIAASQQGEFLYLSVDEAGDWLRVGIQDYPLDITDDPMLRAKYLDAFKKLCESGYITYDRGRLFRLTDAGFERSRKLAAKSQKIK